MQRSAETLRRRRAAAERSGRSNAEHRKCPRCLRRAALSAPVRDAMMVARRCNYCGHEVGHIEGKSFGRDVTPEPGARIGDQ